MEKDKQRTQKMIEDVKKQVEEKIDIVVQEGIQMENLQALGKLVDIHKDIANEEYWEKKKEVMQMQYGNYGNYGRENYGRRMRDSRGRYMEGNSGRRYGEEMINEMYRNYQGYSEGREQYGRGNYGAKEETMKSLEYMLESMVDFVAMLKEDANSQQEMDLIKHYTKKISEM